MIFLARHVDVIVSGSIVALVSDRPVLARFCVAEWGYRLFDLSVTLGLTSGIAAVVLCGFP